MPQNLRTFFPGLLLVLGLGHRPALATQTASPPPFGTVLATLPFATGEMVVDPAQSYIYSNVGNGIEVINTQTLTAVSDINLGTTAGGICLSPNGKVLYVAEQSTGKIAEISTQTLSVINSVTPPSAPLELAAGSGNRLFVLDSTAGYPQIQQIDATSGAVVGSFPSIFAYYGNFQISPDLNTLYYGQHGLSPTTLYSFNVSTTNVSVNSSVSTGSNGKDVTLSHNGRIVSQPNGAPYAVSLLNSSDLSTLGVLNTGAYPSDMAFSPDDAVAYTTTYPYSQLTAYSTSTFTSEGSISLGVEFPGSITVDNSGQYLFVSEGSNTVVYATGRSVPEPQLGCLAAAIGSLCRRRHRK